MLPEKSFQYYAGELKLKEEEEKKKRIRKKCQKCTQMTLLLFESD